MFETLRAHLLQSIRPDNVANMNVACPTLAVRYCQIKDGPLIVEHAPVGRNAEEERAHMCSGRTGPTAALDGVLPHLSKSHLQCPGWTRDRLGSPAGSEPGIASFRGKQKVITDHDHNRNIKYVSYLHIIFI